jgi:non-ribosomal peptide synthetase component F
MVCGRGPMKMASLELSGLPVDRGLAKIDLTLETFDLAEGISGYLEFSTDLFEAATVERLARHYQTLLAAVVAEPDRAVGELPILTAEERTEILVGWNQPSEGAPQPLLERLVAKARENPEAVAVLFGDEWMTHGELHRRANRLARHLRKLGVGPEMSVGLCIERSLEMPLALLAVLKAGGAWVPLDPEYPKDRLALMIEDTRMPVLVTQEHLIEKLPEAAGHELIVLDRLDVSGESDAEPDWEIHPDTPGADPGRIMGQTLGALVQPA